LALLLREFASPPSVAEVLPLMLRLPNPKPPPTAPLMLLLLPPETAEGGGEAVNSSGKDSVLLVKMLLLRGLENGLRLRKASNILLGSATTTK
jgi:hypothetical protein